jgi:hypothetical protein
VLKKLHVSRADNTHDKKLARFTELDLLIVDDLGLRPLKGDEPIDLYEIVRLRYERGSTVITTNRDTDELHHLLGDPPLASAAMDRLLHDAHVLRLVGDTYRNPPLTGAPNAGTIKQRRQAHETHQAAYGSAWPIRPRPDGQALRALPDGCDHRIRLTDPGAGR